MPMYVRGDCDVCVYVSISSTLLNHVFLILLNLCVLIK